MIRQNTQLYLLCLWSLLNADNSESFPPFLQALEFMTGLLTAPRLQIEMAIEKLIELERLDI